MGLWTFPGVMEEEEEEEWVVYCKVSCSPPSLEEIE
jgi:hypothetical protein